MSTLQDTHIEATLYSKTMSSFISLQIEHRSAQMQFHKLGTCDAGSLDFFGCMDCRTDDSTSRLRPAQQKARTISTAQHLYIQTD